MASKAKTGEELKKVWSLGPLSEKVVKPMTGEDLKKVWSLGEKPTKPKAPQIDPAKEWLKGGKKKRITRKHRSKKKWTSSATRKRN